MRFKKLTPAAARRNRVLKKHIAPVFVPYASHHGMTPAAQHYSKRFAIHVSETMVRLIKSIYMKGIQGLKAMAAFPWQLPLFHLYLLHTIVVHTWPSSHVWVITNNEKILIQKFNTLFAIQKLSNMQWMIWALLQLKHLLAIA